MKRFVVALSLFIVTPVFAQQQTPAEKVLSSELLQNLNAKLQCTAAVMTLQARVKELEEKYEPKTEPKPETTK